MWKQRTNGFEEYRAGRIDAEPNSTNRQRPCKGKAAALTFGQQIRFETFCPDDMEVSL